MQPLPNASHMFISIILKITYEKGLFQHVISLTAQKTKFFITRILKKSLIKNLKFLFATGVNYYVPQFT